MTQLLEPAELTAALHELPGVYRAGHGRLQVRVKAPTFPDAVRLVSDVAAVAEELNHHPDVDLRYRTVVFTLATHSAGGVTSLDLDLARRILALAGEAGAEVLPEVPRLEVAIDVVDADAVRRFWQVGLGYVEQRTEEGSIELRDPNGAGPVVWFQRMDPPRTERGRIHVDVYIPEAQTRRRVADTIAAGGRLVTDEHAPEWWVLADAEGNELCVCRA
jgi:4a-hydroxytetrahydrobiopterin dehydratase